MRFDGLQNQTLTRVVAFRPGNAPEVSYGEDVQLTYHHKPSVSSYSDYQLGFFHAAFQYP